MPFDGLTDGRAEELDVLLRMREMLAQPGGWCQRSAYRDDGLCLVQAAATASGDPALQLRVVRRIAGQLSWGWIIGGTQRVINYNDDLNTTKADVLALIDRAIAAG